LNSFENQTEIKQKIKFHRVDIDFLNSNSNVKLVSEEKSIDYDNYYNVAHAPNGVTNVHKFQKVTYQNIYNKIDVVFFIPEDSTKVVEYNFIIKPGGKISDIQMQFNGAKTELANNRIKMKTRFGDMEETLPMSWIEEENNKKQVSIQYKKIKNNVYSLESSEDLFGKKVIIDPVPTRLWGLIILAMIMPFLWIFVMIQIIMFIFPELQVAHQISQQLVVFLNPLLTHILTDMVLL
jgi:ribosomal protein S12